MDSLIVEDPDAVGARKSLNGRQKIQAQKKLRTSRRAPGDKVPNGWSSSGFSLLPEKL